MLVRTAFTTLLAAVLALLLSAPGLAAPRDRTPPSKPTTLRIAASTDTSVTLAWTTSTDNSSNWWYCIQRSGSGCVRVDPPKTSFVYPLLMPATTYTFTIVAIDAAGNRSEPSNAVTITTPPDTTAPTAPVLSVTSVVPTRISATWTRSTDNTSQVGYTLLLDGTTYLGPLVGFESVLIPYLAPESTHSLQVIAADRFGNSAASNVVTVTTPAATDTVAPSAPSNLLLSPETSSPEIWLDWTAASDDVDPPGQLLYEVWVNDVRASTGLGNVEDIVYCATTGPNTIKARALDASGNASAFSNELVFVC